MKTKWGECASGKKKELGNAKRIRKKGDKKHLNSERKLSWKTGERKQNANTTLVSQRGRHHHLVSGSTRRLQKSYGEARRESTKGKSKGQRGFKQTAKQLGHNNELFRWGQKSRHQTGNSADQTLNRQT